MQIATPRFRTDLVAQPIEENGQLLVEVTDPDSGDSFRFYEVEYYLAAAMDGSLDVEGLRRWSAEELGLEPPPAEIETLIRTLNDLGYLQAGAVDAAADVSTAPMVAPITAAPVAAAANLELGLPGGAPPPVAAPVEAADVELGLPGSVPAPAVSPAPVEAGDFELGVAGKSEIERPKPNLAAPPDVALGTAGKAPPLSPSAVSAKPPVIDMPAPTPPAPAATGDEMSFAGLLEDEARPEQTVPTDGDFGLDGITPPPAEVPVPSLTPRTSPDLDDDGPTNLPPAIPIGQEDDEVSVDLSAHLDIGVGDVKEAVRASQVMSAVDVPAELLAELGDDSAPEPPEVAPTPMPVAKAPPAPPAAAEQPAGSTPIELPDTRAAVSKPHKKPDEIKPPVAAPKKGGSGLTIFLALILIAALAGGGWYYYTQVLNKDDEKTSKPTRGKTPTTRPVGTKGPKGPKGPEVPPKPKPKPPTAKLVKGEAPSGDIVLERSGIIEWLAEDGAEVNEGDVVAKYKGVAKLEAKVAAVLLRKKTKYQPPWDKAKKALDEAKAADKKAQIKRWERALKAAQAQLDRKDREAAKYRDRIPPLLIKTTLAGTFKRIAKPGRYVNKQKPIGSIGGVPSLTATFKKVKDVKKYAVGSDATIHALTNAAQKTTCKVSKSEGDEVAIKCPGGGPIGADTDVVLE